MGNSISRVASQFAPIIHRDWTSLLETIGQFGGLLIFAMLLMSANVGRADIFQWEFVNPADPSQGKQQSMMLCPDGAGVSATPNSVLSNLNLTMADLIGADLSGVDLGGSNLTNADLSGANIFSANLTNTNLHHANLAGAFFSDAVLKGADLGQTDLRNTLFNRVDLTGANLSGALIQGAGSYDGLAISLSQLYSTASYQSHDLQGTSLVNCDFTGGDFSNQNLAGAAIVSSNLTNATFHQANLSGATLGRSYILGAPPSTLIGMDFSGANLTQANLAGADLTSANFSGAQIRDASFSIDTDLGTGGISPAQLYSTASYQSHDLGKIQLAGNDLTGTDFSAQNIVQAYFVGANLTGVNFSGAMIRGAIFQGATGFTLSQLYSTASYQSHDLPQTYFGMLNLSGGSFVAQNLNGSNFQGATLTGTDFGQANLTSARFDSGVYVGAPITVLGNSKFIAANLSGADFIGTDVTAVNFTSAIIQSARFDRIIPGGVGVTGGSGPDIVKDGVGGLSLAQLYSTASYQNHELSGIGLGHNDLTGVNLSGQNLSGASFGGTVLTGANFAHANLIGSYLSQANLTGADFTASDMRGAAGFQLDLTQSITTNTIRPDGHVSGLDLGAGQQLVVRNMITEIIAPTGGTLTPTAVFPAIPITVDQHLNMASGGVLQLLFDANPWESLVSFQSGIPVQLGGTLDLEFADGVDIGSQLGQTIHLFDWTGVTPSGNFSIGGPYNWDVSQLYTSGDVTLTAVPEPTSLILMLFGGFGLIACVVAKRRRANGTC